MLGVFKLIFIFCFCFSACFSVSALNRPIVTLVDDDPTEITLKQAFSIQEEQDMKELVRLIVELRHYLVCRGCYFPRPTAFLEYCRVQAYAEGVEIDDDVFDRLWEEFASYEVKEDFPAHQIKHKHHKHHKKEKEVKISGRMAVGFLKFVGGSLLCLIPVPVIQGAGASLAVIGVNDMLNASRDQSAEKEAEERIESNRRLDAALEQ
jgi:hypothetical protein